MKNILKNYKPFNTQEEKDLNYILNLIESNNNLYSRDNEQYHFTASGWVVNKEHSKALMVYHNIYNSWSWLGGHADGNHNLLEVAIKEVKEESGLTELSVEHDIFSIEVLNVKEHIRKGKIVKAHKHLNITYLIEADVNQPLRIKPDENKGVQWFDLNQIESISNEPEMVEIVYKKLIRKLEEKKCLRK